MNTPILRLLLVLVVGSTLSNCTTVYDEYGRPQQVVTPEGAVLGAAAIGLLAYGLATSDDDGCDYDGDRYHRGGYSRHHRHRRY